MLIVEAFFWNKICHNFKSIKSVKESFLCIYIDLTHLKISAKFPGKVTRKKELSGEKKPSIYKSSTIYIFKVSKHPDPSQRKMTFHFYPKTSFCIECIAYYHYLLIL